MKLKFRGQDGIFGSRKNNQNGPNGAGWVGIHINSRFWKNHLRKPRYESKVMTLRTLHSRFSNNISTRLWNIPVKNHLSNWTRSQPLSIPDKRKAFFHLPLSQQWFLPLFFCPVRNHFSSLFHFATATIIMHRERSNKKMRIHTKICGWRNYQQVQTIPFYISFLWTKTISFS